MKKYKLTKKSIKVFGRTLFQIQALIDFGIVKKGELVSGGREATNYLDYRQRFRLRHLKR